MFNTKQLEAIHNIKLNKMYLLLDQEVLVNHLYYNI